MKKLLEERRNMLRKKRGLLNKISEAEIEELAKQEIARLKGEERTKRVRRKFEEGKRTGNRTLRFLEKGVEARTVTKYKRKDGTNIVLKSYEIGSERIVGRPTQLQNIPITEEEFIDRFNFQKEAYEKGLPIAEPISIKKVGNKIIWREREIEGKTIKEFLDENNEILNSKKSTSKQKEEASKRIDKLADAFQKSEKELTPNLGKTASAAATNTKIIHGAAMFANRETWL